MAFKEIKLKEDESKVLSAIIDGARHRRSIRLVTGIYGTRLDDTVERLKSQGIVVVQPYHQSYYVTLSPSPEESSDE